MTPESLDKEIGRITTQIIEKYKPNKIILFGSAVWGGTTDDSDLDFLIVKENSPYLGRDRMRELYPLIIKDCPADFLIYKPNEIDEGLKQGDPFLKRVISEGRVLYG